MTTQEPITTANTTLNPLFVVIVIVAERLARKTTVQNDPIWRDPAWLARIDDTTLGEAD